MLQEEHSAILSTFIKLQFVFKTFVLSIFKWLLKTGFTVVKNLFFLQYSAQVSSNSLIFNKGALEMNLIGEVMEDHTLDSIIKPVPGHYFQNKFYSETCLKRPLIKNTKISFQYQLSLN